MSDTTTRTNQQTHPEPRSAPTIGATVLGYPRIGRRRELKKALEAYWGAVAADGHDLPAHAAGLERTAQAVRADALATMGAAGLDTVPVGTFSYYDQMLDTAVLVDAVPRRFRVVEGAHQLSGFPAERYFAMARGTSEIAPLEMTKWFDTNYHYLVPEIDSASPFELRPEKLLHELVEGLERDLRPRPVVVGPWTFLRLAKPAADAADGFTPMDRLEELVGVYADLLTRLAEEGAEWVQLDEPAAVAELTSSEVDQLRGVYARLAAVGERPAILVATYFAAPSEALPALVSTGIEGVALDLTRGVEHAEVAEVAGITGVALVLGVVDGRNVWRNDLSATRATLDEWDGLGREVAVSSSCSLLHVPYDKEVEVDLDPSLREYLSFAVQKVDEVVALQRAFESAGPLDDEVGARFRSAHAAVARRDRIPGLRRDDIGQRVARVVESDRRRASRKERDEAQRRRLDLPVLPTTTIGSFPQTGDVRRSRAQLRAGTLGWPEYEERMRAEIRAVVALQEEVGLDVMVHGEPERNDMVQYFAEQLDGFASTQFGWVQSYGSRCVRPPLLYGDVARPEPMTVPWASFAQSLTAKPMKGMLTGPVTMLAWSFVRVDQPRHLTADQVALALRDEVLDLESAGIAIIQVDEPALRELLPLREAERQSYLTWSVESFRLATSGVESATQVHTHLCYSEFGEIIGAIDDLDADVTSIEAARSGMELLRDIAEHGFGAGLGPGVYDIHSPRVPSQAEMSELLGRAVRALPPEQLWVNPDCGLKTRGYAEVEPTLRNLVSAAQDVRARS